MLATKRPVSSRTLLGDEVFKVSVRESADAAERLKIPMLERSDSRVNVGSGASPVWAQSSCTGSGPPLARISGISFSTAESKALLIV